jgi:hypothetical protein
MFVHILTPAVTIKNRDENKILWANSNLLSQLFQA